MSRSVNKVLLLGHLGRDAEVRHAGNGAAVCSFTLATSHRYKAGEEWREETTWHAVTLWNGERLVPYLKKGTRAYVEGRIRNRSWEQDGQTRRATEIVAESVILLTGGGDAAEPPAKPAARPAANRPGPGALELTDDDVPF